MFLLEVNNQKINKFMDNWQQTMRPHIIFIDEIIYNIKKFSVLFVKNVYMNAMVRYPIDVGYFVHDTFSLTQE